MDHRDGKKSVDAHHETLPTDDQAAILLLEPGKGALGLKAGDVLLDWSPTWGLALPDPLRDLCPHPPVTELLAQGLGVIPFIRLRTGKRFRGCPRLPVRRRTASSRGMTWARSSLLAGVVQVAKGIPAPSVRL